MSSIWDNIAIKNVSGVQSVTNAEKNVTIESAVTTWTNMGLTQEQIAFGVATMGVESAFNPAAQATTTSAYGLGQFTNDTWVDAVNRYNTNYGGNLDPAQSRSDAAAQITVMGAWIDNVWSLAQARKNSVAGAAFEPYSISQVAYGLWHEGIGKSAYGLVGFFQHPKKFNNQNVGGYFDLTFDQASKDLGILSSPRLVIPNLLDALSGLRNYFTTAQSTPVSPIILDLDGDGVETLGVTAGAYFDHDGNGFAESTGWVGADDGLLVWDRNGDGRINDGKELFGSETLLSGGTKAANGYQALSELDTNTDGKVDVNDAAFAGLKVWKDLDGDGYSAASELISLTDTGVQSINIGATSSTYTDPNGNAHKLTGSFTKTDGTIGATADVWFQTNKLYTIQEESLTVPADIAALPDLRGYGNVYDFHSVMGSHH